MVSNISSTLNINKNTAFADFKQPAGGYYISVPYAKEVNEKKSHKLGTTIVISSLVAGFGALALLSGGANKGIAKFLNKWKSELEKKLAKGSKFEDLFMFLLNRVKSFQAKTESINNFTTLKDVIFQRIMWGKHGERKFTKKIHQSITTFFDKMSRKTVNHFYNDATSNFAELSDKFMRINTKLREAHSTNPKVLAILDKIEARISTLNENVEKGFGINARNERFLEIQKACEGLFDFFWDASLKDVKNFKSKNMWQSFIAEDYLVPTKLKLMNKTASLRQQFTHDIADNYKSTMNAVSNIQAFVSPSDTATNNLLRTLRKNLEKYNKLSGKNEVAQRNQLNQEIILNLQDLSKEIQNSATRYKYSPDSVVSISKYIKEVEEIISKTEKGELQEILTLYKQLLPRDEYVGLRNKANSAVKSLDKAIDTEINQYVDKARDLKLGSAPTDVISVLVSMGAVGYYLNKADNKDERYSVGIKYGIPAVGAIATSLYCTARLISGGKALFFGLLSGWLLNKACVAIDDTRKKYSLDISLINKSLTKSQPDKV